MEAIKCEVVWSWVGKRAFLQNDLIPPTPILLRHFTEHPQTDRIPAPTVTLEPMIINFSLTPTSI